MIKRVLFKTIEEHCHQGRAILLIGPRQSGKTTLLNELVGSMGDYLFLDADDANIRQQLAEPSYEKLRQLIGNHKLVFIDEAQRIKDAGITLKMVTDRFKDVQLFISGSSAMELGNLANEPLTGRKWEFNLLPISWQELQNQVGFLSATQQLENRIIYGMYPSVLNSLGNEEMVLNELTSAYLYKDILALSGIQKPEVLENLVRALALQCGSEVSLNELASLLNIDKNTVSTYIRLLEQAFVVFRLPSYSTNQRTEIRHGNKVYFYDNGIRNAVIKNFNPLSLRQDVGALWENFMISERVKFLNNNLNHTNSYFWRTTAQQEVDYIEERGGHLSAFELKWKTRKKMRQPKAFATKYDAQFKLITPDNFWEFLTI